MTVSMLLLLIGAYMWFAGHKHRIEAKLSFLLNKVCMTLGMILLISAIIGKG